MTASSLIPMKVRAILPLCGSEIDGEALGACRAVGRVLNAAGFDFRDLAAAIRVDEPAVGYEMSRRRDKSTAERSRGPIPPYDAYSWRRAYTPGQEAEHRARVRFCQGQAWRLTAWEREFVNNVARLHGNLSIKQGDRLAAMTDRLDMEARRA